jgi:hypothetical protein
MNKLPVQAEDPAVTFARAEIVFHRNNKMPIGDMEVSFLDKAARRKVAVNEIKRSAMLNALNMMITVQEARAGWDLAREALEDILLEYDNRGLQPETYLAAYRMDLVKSLLPPQLGGKKKHDKFFRNIVIVVTVKKVMEQFNLNPTRTSTSPRRSACSVVADALQKEGHAMGEGRVVRVWEELQADINDLTFA